MPAPSRSLPGTDPGEDSSRLLVRRGHDPSHLPQRSRLLAKLRGALEPWSRLTVTLFKYVEGGQSSEDKGSIKDLFKSGFLNM